MAKAKEGQIQKAILKALSIHYPEAIILRYNNTPTYDPRTNQFRSQHGTYIPYGVSDIFMFCRKRAIAIELKTEDKYFYIERNWDKLERGEFLKPKRKGRALTNRERFHYQIKFINEMKRTGNFGFFTYEVDHCLTQLKNYFGEYNGRRNDPDQMSLLPICMD